MNIETEKNYSLTEIIKLGLIPGVSTYANMYKLVTDVISKNGEIQKVVPEETTKLKIKPMILRKRPNVSGGRGRLGINGAEILKFLKFNNL